MQFLIFGKGAYEKELSNKIEQLQLKNIKLEGRIDYCKVYTILSYSKISFISLKNRNMTDSVPTKIFDALGIGCPILLLAKGDSCKILEEANLGEYVEESKDLRDKLKYMMNHYDQYKKNKEEAIGYIQNNYSRKKIAEKFESEVLKNVGKD